MNARLLLRRAFTLHVLLALTAVTAGRLALDAQAVGTAAAIEAEHGRDCPPFHDHQLCTLLLRTPWAPAIRASVCTHTDLVSIMPPAGAGSPLDLSIVSLPAARAPPTA